MSLVKITYKLAKFFLPKLGFVSKADNFFAKKTSPNNQYFPPIFIVGAPRTGTTILYQSLLTTKRLTYFSNVESLFFTLPTIVHYFMEGRKRCCKDKGEVSHYGYVSGLEGPSEAGALMRYFLDGPDSRVEEFGIRIAAMSRYSQAPLLTKNTFNSLRIDKIAKSCPSAFVIWVKRNSLATRKSILRMRQELAGNEASWVGAGKPKDLEILNASPEAQADYQIAFLNREIENALSRTGLANIVVKYEDFCENRTQQLKLIWSTYQLESGVPND